MRRSWLTSVSRESIGPIHPGNRRFHRQPQRALALRPDAANLTTVAQDAGYFDQPHFINHFRRVTGLSPAAWFDQARAN